MKTLDAKLIANMFLAGAKNLENKKEWINELNVFPVPDGDTGTNMTMTILSAVTEIKALKDINMKTLAKAIANGSLKGARGNSGVILSQLIRGFSKVMIEHEELDFVSISEAMTKATETAYKAVMRPKEGTVLTVANMMSKAANECNNKFETLEEFFEFILKEGQKALDNTPNQLPVLKEAGVVDSGGQGLMQFLYGAYNYLIGKQDADIDLSVQTKNETKIKKSTKAEISTADINFGYCTEFIVMLKEELSIEQKEEFRDYLLSIGDSLVFVADEELIKVHVHTNHPGKAFEKGLLYGELTRMKVDNMREEHREIIEEEGYDENDNIAISKEIDERVSNGFVAISVGNGFTETFNALGVNYIVEGGQTMNPSTKDICDAVDRVNADNVYILPNNKNIILAANQVADIITDKNIIIIPTTTIPEGIAAMVAYPDSDDYNENKETMLEAINLVKTGEVTYAVRNTKLDGFEINVDEIMGIYDGKIRSVGKDINETTIGLIDSMVDEDSSVICIYYGDNISKEDVASLSETVEERYPDCDVEIIEGGQPVYYYLISVE